MKLFFPENYKPKLDLKQTEKAIKFVKDFFQENLYAGWRFLNRRCEIQFGILNLGNQDYHLNPLNVYTELPRERTYTVRLKFIF